MNEDLRSPATDAEWCAYHSIRRDVLFERRGQGDAYDANHPDELQPGHFPLILWSGSDAVGVIRIDIADRVAIFRRVAVRADVQRLGLGRHLLRSAEQFAQARGCTRVDSQVDADAIGFYQRCGYQRVIDAPPGKAVLMTKVLAAE